MRLSRASLRGGTVASYFPDIRNLVFHISMLNFKNGHDTIAATEQVMNDHLYLNCFENDRLEIGISANARKLVLKYADLNLRETRSVGSRF